MSDPTPLYSAAQARQFDSLASAAGVAGGTLMARAGAAAFAALRARWPQARRIMVVCGVGNNAGDGFVLARLARAAGCDVSVLQVGDVSVLRGDALQALDEYRAAGGVPQDFNAADLETADVLVDALFGTGLTREVGGTWRAAIEAMNAATPPVLALDLPSGVHADSGAVLGAAVRAAVTVTFIARKQGLYTGAGLAHAGHVVFDALAVPPHVYAGATPGALLLARDALADWLPPRSRDAHKGRFGHVLVVGGEQGMSGAVRLAAEAAARAGAGLVSVATRAAHAAVLSAARPELMCHGVEHATQLAPLLARASVIAIGPGLGRGEWARELLGHALDTQLPLVVDADALNLLAREPLRRDNWILTPHSGEAARLLQCSTADIEADRYQAVRELAARFGGVAVLKGAGTLIARQGESVRVCGAGNPGMASGGMGDVLTGVIAGLLAQGLPLFEAAQAGVQVHALAGDAAARDGERGLLATDLMPCLRRIVNPVPHE
jgi:ADP-dependent NAD(P)H-hydrate dehydratase / NAD(P)H-hydrate epimerase